VSEIPKLYVFALSHFSEKARWACERKRVPFQLVPLLPGLHVLTMRRLSSATHVPLLQHGNDVVQDSSGIISYIDRHYAGAPLTPEDPEARAEALRWESELDRELGETTRRLFYSHALAAPQFLSSEYTLGAPRWSRWFYALALPLIIPRVRNMYQVDAAGVQQDQQRLAALFQRLDRHFATHRYLAGDRFSRADLTLAALAAGMFRPPEHPAQRFARATLPSWVEAMAPFRDTLTAERVLDLYRTERGATAARAPASAAA
jgi:glutathione S-transferase